MKKVVILHPAHWEQAMGGAELQISYLAKTLRKHNIEVHFIFEDKGKIISNADALYLHPLKKIRIRKYFGQRWFLYKKEIFKLLNIIKPDVIYTRFYSSWSGFAALYSKANSVKHIWAVAHDNDLIQKPSLKFIRRPFDAIEYFYLNRVFTNSEIITQNTFQELNLFGKHQRQGVKILQMTPLVNENMLIKTNSDINVVWVANLKPIKHPQKFIQLVESCSKIEKIKFRMVGRMGNSYLPLINNVKNKNFKYLGELPNEEVNEILCKAHLLISTSDAEGFSNTFVQAWMRKVIVLSMNSNPDNIITEQGIGFVCPTLEELKVKIELLINNNEIRNEMSEKAYKYAIENHSLEKNIVKVMNLMEVK